MINQLIDCVLEILCIRQLGHSDYCDKTHVHGHPVLKYEELRPNLKEDISSLKRALRFV